MSLRGLVDMVEVVGYGCPSCALFSSIGGKALATLYAAWLFSYPFISLVTQPTPSLESSSPLVFRYSPSQGHNPQDQALRKVTAATDENYSPVNLDLERRTLFFVSSMDGVCLKSLLKMEMRGGGRGSTTYVYTSVWKGIRTVAMQSCIKDLITLR